MTATANHFEIEATPRQAMGKGNSRRLRREEKIPAVVYGGGKDALSITLERHKTYRALQNEAFYSHILTLKIDGTPELVILKDVARHPYLPHIQHVDFLRVREDEKLRMTIPLHFRGDDEAPGVKDAGGVISHIVSEVEVTCLPKDLPPFLELDISDMQLNQIKHLSDIVMPAGVECVALLHQNDQPVVSVHMPRIEEEPAPAEDAAPISAEVPAIEQKSEAEIAAEAAATTDKKKK
jgi:large subunit ribosomal protein L25